MADGSLLDELRALDERLRAHSTKTLNVPGTGGRVAVRYSPPQDRSKLRSVMVAFSTGEPLSPVEELQLLIDCRGEVLRADPETGTTQPFDDQGPLYFDSSDHRWGDDVSTARECVSKLFRLDLQPLATGGHVASIIQWLNGLDAEIAARVEKNSRSGEAS